MSVLPIVTYPDRRLKRICGPVNHIHKNIHGLIDDMFETMYDAPGVGLAAPQVGRLLRVIVVDASPHHEGAEALAMINPEVIWTDGQILWEEGCLSVPDLVVDVPRFERLSVAGLDPSGRRLELEAQGLLAVALQHELDHLDGRLIIDHLSRLKREIYRKKRLKAEAQAGR